jgi:hypothetical protein
MQYKTFKEFYWKRSLPAIGLPWGFMTGIIYAIIQNKDVLKYFTSWQTLFLIGMFILAGFLLAYTYGKSLWKRGKAYEAQKEKEQQQPES